MNFEYALSFVLATNYESVHISLLLIGCKDLVDNFLKEA